MVEHSKTSITVETRSQTLIRRVAAPPEDRCLVCGISVPVLSVLGAAMMMGVDPAAIEEDLAAGLVHHLGPDGVCGLSVANRYLQTRPLHMAEPPRRPDGND